MVVRLEMIRAGKVYLSCSSRLMCIELLMVLIEEVRVVDDVLSLQYEERREPLCAIHCPLDSGPWLASI